jgi:hypothetical protein
MSDTVHFLSVTYRSRVVFPAFADSLIAQTSPRWRCTVLENSPQAELQPVLQELNSALPGRFNYEWYPSNPGYLPAVQQWMAASIVPDDVRFLVVCNPDLAIGQDFVSCLLESEPDQIHAPSVVDERFAGRDMNPYLLKKPSLTKLGILAVLAWLPSSLRSFAVSSSTRRRTLADSSCADGQRMFAPHGSVLVLPRAYFSVPDALRNASPLYGEEILVGNWAERLDIDVSYRPALRVRHIGSHSTGRETPYVRRSRRQAAVNNLRLHARM